MSIGLNALGVDNQDFGKVYGAPRSVMGQTGNQRTQGFVAIRMQGIDALSQALISIAGDQLGVDYIKSAVRSASNIIKQSYKGAAEFHDATGNLAASTKVKPPKVYYDFQGRLNTVVGVVGPEQTGKSGATSDRPSGNHAWLVEYGSAPRRPGTQNRRTYINVHQMINGRMSRHSATNDEAFSRMSKGYYFLMGSLREPTRQARRGSGYSHDFVSDPTSDEGLRPMTLHPGETYGAMPAFHLMERTIQHESSAVMRTLEQGLRRAIQRTIQQQATA